MGNKNKRNIWFSISNKQFGNYLIAFRFYYESYYQKQLISYFLYQDCNHQYFHKHHTNHLNTQKDRWISFRITFRTVEMIMPTLSLLLIKCWYFHSYRSFEHKYILPMSGWFSIKFNNWIQFAFPDSDPLLLIFCMDDLEYIAKFYYT